MLQFKIICKNGLSKKRQVCIEPKKGGVAMTGASKILALPERGGKGLTHAKIYLVDLIKCTKANLK